MTETQPQTHAALVESILSTIGPADFNEWRDEQQFAENIRTGRQWLNTPPPIKPPEEHNPSQLYQCHRKIYYRQLNAPEETEDPDGIFWTGNKFEEEVVMPYLEDLVGGRAYVRNSMWVEYTVESAVGEIRIRGKTDPVIVDSESNPILPTEVKTKTSIKNTTEPSEHHVAQLLAYMEGLSRDWKTEVRDGLVIYADRTNLNLKVFHIQFDRAQWEDLVRGWAEMHSEYRLAEELPPADPIFEWECSFCSFKHRCGKGSKCEFEDLGSVGFIPGFVEYPRDKVVGYLEANKGARLTPTLAYQFPDLAKRYGVHEWKCEACPRTYSVEDVEWDRSTSERPVCPACAKRGVPAHLCEPKPEEQYGQNHMSSEAGE